MVNLHEILPVVAEEVFIPNILIKYGCWLDILCYPVGT